MPRKKNYRAILLPTELTGPVVNGATIDLPRNPRNHRKIDHNQYLGLGFDDWAVQSLVVIKALLKRNNLFVSTLVGYSTNGLRFFMRFLSAGLLNHPPVTPNNLTRKHIESYISWLKLNYPNGSTAKNYYTSLKSLLVAFADYGFIHEDIKDLLPPNAFPNSFQKINGASPLSMGEMQRLVNALKSDLIAIHKGQFTGNGAEAMSVLLLITAARSGINTTPLLEMARDALMPHPFMPNLKLINTIKRRSKGAQIKTIRQSNLVDKYTAIPLDGVAVVNKALEISMPLIALAPEDIASYVWLYRSGQRGGEDKIVTLTPGAVHTSTKKICERHFLKGDDGKRLRVTLSRLRKTMEGRLWMLSGGDILEVSSIMGHSPAVADNHYLKISDDIKAEGARFVDEAFVDKLRAVDITRTPSGGCKDTLRGFKAPKDGLNHCSEFLHCLECASYAIVGELDDLYRLFSYQQFLIAEIYYYPTEEWEVWRNRQRQYIKSIDEFSYSKLDSNVVRQAKVKAEADPHPFWATKIKYLKKKMEGLI